MALRVLVTITIVALGASQDQVKRFSVLPETVVATNMVVREPELPRRLSSASLVVPDTNAPASGPIRVHIRVVSAGSDPWTVAISDSEGNHETIAHDSPYLGDSGAWSTEFDTPTVRIRLEAAANVHVEFDKYAVRDDPSFPQAIVDGDQLTAVTADGIPDLVKARSSSVARLKFMKRSKQDLCTGFLVGGNLLMTNQHCIVTDEASRSMLVEFGVDSDASVPMRFRVVKVEASNFALDYALLRLSAPPPAELGRLYFGGAVGEKHRLFVLQHPGGRPKQVSFFPHCMSGALTASGREGEPTDFGHVCDTLGGSSGAPVIDWITGLVVGLHHLGFSEGSAVLENQAVHIVNLLADLKKRVDDAIYAEVTKAR